MAERNLIPIAGNTLFAGKSTTYKHYRCTLMQNDDAADVVINGINVFTAAGVQSVIDISPLDLGTDPGADVTFWCHCLDGCSILAFSGTTAPGAGALANPYSGMSAMNKPTIIGGGGLNN